MDNSGKFVWFFAGAALGATVALLYAPQSGEATRRIIRKKSRQGGEFVAETGRELYEKGLRVADEAAELIERGRRIVEG
jgi:gas vesicle protein